AEKKVGFTAMAAEKKAGNIPEIGIGMLGYAFMGKAHSNGYKKMPYIFWPPPARPKLIKMCGRTEEKVAEEANRYGYLANTFITLTPIFEASSIVASRSAVCSSEKFFWG
ncbi:unnamed protein product, partial [marine sediment metagenome]